MVLGLMRPRLRSDGSGLFALRNLPMALHPAGDWVSERGEILFEASADIIGGFPGYADRCCALAGAYLRITDRFLLADEGHPQGFGLPLSWIEGSTLVAQPGRDDYALRIFFRVDGMPRLFTIRFRTNRIGARGPRRSLRAQEALHTAGIVDRFAAEPPQQPNFTLPWDQTREFENENVIWTGRATAPVRVGSESAPSEVWLTTKSLIWGSGDGEGINRIPLPLLMDLVSTRLRDRLGTPVIYVAIGDDSTGRYELPFSFDLQTPPDRNFRERGAFLVGLRSRGIIEGVTAPYNQPWRANLLTTEPEPGEYEFACDENTEAVDDGSIDLASYDELPSLLRTESTSHIEPVLPWSAPNADEPPPELGGEPVRRRGGLAGRILRSTALRVPQQIPEPAFHAETTGEVEAASVELESRQLDIAVDFVTEEALSDQFADLGVVAEEQEDPTERFTIVSTSEHAVVEDVVLAEWSSGGADITPADLTIAETWAASRTETAGVVSPAVVEVEPPAGDVEPDPLVTITTEPWAAVRRYEEIAVGALSEALRVIDDCVAGHCGAPLAEHAPSSWDQARALAELKELVARGDVSEDDARHRKERLLALGETCVRLRTLIELHDHGYLSAGDLDRKRVSLVNGLSAALVRSTAPSRPIADVA